MTMKTKELPHYYVTMTLLASKNPDVNRRSIRRASDDACIAVFNSEMRPWTEEMERELQWCLAALRRMAAKDFAATEMLFPPK